MSANVTSFLIAVIKLFTFRSKGKHTLSMATKPSAKTPKDVEQCAVIKFCLKLKQPPIDTKKVIEEVSGNKPVCRALFISGTNNSVRAGTVLTMMIGVLCRSKTALGLNVQNVKETIDRDHRITLRERSLSEF